MYDNDSELRNLLESAEIKVTPDAGRAQAVRQRTLDLARRPRGHPRLYRATRLAALVVFAVTGVGLAATQAGRDLIRSLFVPVEEWYQTTWVAPDGSTWSETRNSEPYTAKEEEAIAKHFSELWESQQAGTGRLVGLIETPGFFGIRSATVYLVEYRLSNGETKSVGAGRPTGKQAEKMRIDEIMKLRDAGAGEIVEEMPFSIGLGRYTIRLTLSDGQMVDLKTFYPPSTQAEREAIFKETRALRKELRFTVVHASAHGSGVSGLLRYTLADGRTVGATQQIPKELVSEDGTQIVMPDTQERIEIQREAY